MNKAGALLSESMGKAQPKVGLGKEVGRGCWKKAHFLSC